MADKRKLHNHSLGRHSHGSRDSPEAIRLITMRRLFRYLGWARRTAGVGRGRDGGWRYRPPRTHSTCHPLTCLPDLAYCFDRKRSTASPSERASLAHSLQHDAPQRNSSSGQRHRHGLPQRPRRAAPGIAWTHGTTGVVPGCAPSLLDDPFANVPALRQLIDKGWVYVATDYVGLGTSGPHPYLIGEGEARSALDSIRALRQMEGIRVGDGTVVWGHSQGGHAALWTGIVAPVYAPDMDILGVAAVAPASDLRPLVEAVQGTPVGRIMSSFVLRSYSEAYPDVEFDAYVSGLTRWVARDVAGRCLAGREALFSVAEILLTGDGFFTTAPTSGATRRAPGAEHTEPAFATTPADSAGIGR